MQTLGMASGDLFIDERGQPVLITGRNKLIQDISEALNSSYDSNKKFGGRIINLNLEYSEVYNEINTILERLMKTQTNTSRGEKIKTINRIEVIQKQTTVYAYIEVTSDIDEIVGNDYVILGG